MTMKAALVALVCVLAAPVGAQSAFDMGLNPQDGRPLTVLELQAALQVSMVYDGPLDGVMGPETEAALVTLAQRYGYGYTPGGAVPADMNQFLYFSLAVALGGDGCEDC